MIGNDLGAMSPTNALDIWLDHLETIARALSQREMTDDQRERLYRLLEQMYGDARRVHADKTDQA